MYNHPAHTYAQDVRSGKIPSNEDIRNAVNRYFDDLKNGEARGIYFNPEYPLHVFEFFQLLKHTKGEWAGKPFTIQPWQMFIIWNLFGFRNGSEYGPNRYKIAYIEVPRKNGKTEFTVAIQMYWAYAAGQKGGEIYFAATKKDQADIGFKMARQMAKMCKPCKVNSKIETKRIYIEALDNEVRSLASDRDTLDGLNMLSGLIDELHAHKDSGVVDVLKTSTGSRDVWMMVEITTAGAKRNGVCWDHREHTRKVCAGIIEDDRWFGLVYGLDQGDDFRDEQNWIKANPNLDVSKKREFIRGEVKEAINRPSYENTVLRYDFNVWVDTLTGWIGDTEWQNAEAPQDTNWNEIEILPMYAGLDIGSTDDFTAHSRLFIDLDNDVWYLKTSYVIPRDTLDSRIRKQVVSFDAWERAGWMQPTDGNIIDDSKVTERVLKDIEGKDLRELSYDKYKAHSGVIQEFIRQNLPVTAQAQNIMAMSEPTKEFEKRIKSGRLLHDGNPVTRWMMSNVVIHTDANGNIKVLKNKSHEKIDGVVSAIMAVAGALEANLESSKSVYNNKEMKWLD